MTAILQVLDLHGGYTPEVDIIKGLTLSLSDRQIATVAGTNGAGKSTLAKAVVGLLPQIRGDIFVDGHVVTLEPAEKRAHLGIGYVPQVANVFGGLSVLENLQIVADVHRCKGRIDEMFARFPALAQRRHAYASGLSGGERQQLAFARALVPNPKIMVLDEPTAALSPAKVAEAFQLIRTLPSFGVSVLIVEQRARQALAISDYGYVMDGGKIALEGEADTLLADERAADLYLGRGRAPHETAIRREKHGLSMVETMAAESERVPVPMES
jgi:ABC-type branched-subunit amino acid transport system ATPase component